MFVLVFVPAVVFVALTDQMNVAVHDGLSRIGQGLRVGPVQRCVQMNCCRDP